MSLRRNFKLSGRRHSLRLMGVGMLAMLAFFHASSITKAEDPQTLEVQGIRLSPFIFEQNVPKGESYSNEIALTNTTSETVQISVAIHDFIPAGRHGEVRFLPSNQQTDPHFSLSKWVDITKQPEYTLPPNTTTRAAFKITVPIEADEGTHYGGILFSFSGDPTVGGSKIVQSIGAILVIKTGNAQENGVVESFTTSKTVYSEPAIPFSTLFSNTGSAHMNPKGKIEITNLFGSVVGLAYVNENAQISLPNTTREFNSVYRSPFMFGKYQAKLTMYYGNPKLETRKTLSFWVFPWKTILNIGGIGLFSLLLLIAFISFYNRRILRKAGIRK